MKTTQHSSKVLLPMGNMLTHRSSIERILNNNKTSIQPASNGKGKGKGINTAVARRHWRRISTIIQLSLQGVLQLPQHLFLPPSAPLNEERLVLTLSR